MQIPRLLISATAGGSGKTLLSLGLARAFVNANHMVKPYKKGPDYIDAHWLGKASKNSCTNLDPYFLDSDRLKALFAHSFSQNNNTIALIEGNRGLFDGQDVHGSCSSAELARILDIPVILSLNITKMTRTAAAVLAGLANFEKNLRIGGVVLNEVASTRHENIVRKSIEEYTDIPVLGALPRLKKNPLPERHMGLNDAHELNSENTLAELGEFIKNNCDLSKIFNIAKSATEIVPQNDFWQDSLIKEPCVTIGYIYDKAFWFYYEENLEALRRAGAKLVPLSILDNKAWPTNLAGIYMGGGYPEEFLQELSTSEHLKNIKKYSENHMPIYAECGGFMVLAKEIIRQGIKYSMSGVFDAQTEFFPKPQGLGYIKAMVNAKNPYHPENKEIRGHEFHYSCCLPRENEQNSKLSPLDKQLCFDLEKGVGMGNAKDGLCVRNTFASYTHIYAPNCPWWAENFVELASNWYKSNN